MSIAIMGIGVPGSGKTSVLQPLARVLPATYICPDDIRAELSGGDPTNHEHEVEVWELARARAVQALQTGNVVVDATFSKKEDRLQFVDLLRDAGALHIIGALALVPLEVARERNAARGRIVPEQILVRKFDSLTKAPPSLDEGFDAIVPIEKLNEFLTPSA